MQIIDKNSSNSIDYTEFVMACADRDCLLENNRLEKAFNLFDTDRSGLISKDEIKHILGGGTKYDKQVWEDLIKEGDINGDGEVFKNYIYV